MAAWRGLRRALSGGRRPVWAASLSPEERLRRMLPPGQGAEEPSGAPRAASAPPFRAGELALVEAPRRQRPPLRALCRLAAGAALGAPGGLLLPHDSVLGRPPGEVVRLRGGGRLLVRRPSLEEYALLMPRGPAIAYPKVPEEGSFWGAGGWGSSLRAGNVVLCFSPPARRISAPCC